MNNQINHGRLKIYTYAHSRNHKISMESLLSLSLPDYYPIVTASSTLKKNACGASFPQRVQNRNLSTLKSTGPADVRAPEIGLPISARPSPETTPFVVQRIFHVERVSRENSLVAIVRALIHHAQSSFRILWSVAFLRFG